MFLKLFWSFFKIGLFGFGGGYGMISMIQFDVVDKNGWMTNSEFADILALSQMTPGPISINCATYIGYNQGGIIGAIFTTFALCLPTILLMAIVITWLFKNKENHYVKALLSSLNPIVVGLIFSAGVLMMNKENFVGFESVIVCAIVFVATFFFKVNPIYLIIMSGIFGYFYY
ncbi:MAG: chromate transporter [Paludibacteraceae bacterium]|jgi:chromate transporter|nr:chromate transporter [Paludibacteraceae bacterium]MEE1177704.1 chromate transporter [Paludibacteraceae bacterium]